MTISRPADRSNPAIERGVPKQALADVLYLHLKPHMVFLAISPAGLADVLRLTTDPAISIWCGADAIAESEFSTQRIPHLTRLTYPLLGEGRDVLEGALDTIREHHPGEIVWVEGVGAL